MKETFVNLKSFLPFYCPHIAQWYLNRPRTAMAPCVSVPFYQVMAFLGISGGSITMNL